MSKQINVVLLYGGKSGEHEVSLISAASVLAHLDASKYHIIPVGIDKQGCCYQNNYQELIAFKKQLPVNTANSRVLPSLFVDGHFAIAADVIVPMTHGPLYEDGCLQGLFELADVAYVGCGVLSSAISMDKDMARRFLCGGDIDSARYRVLFSYHSRQQKEQFCQEIAAEFGWPLFVKPCCLGSSVSVHKVKNHQELMAAVQDALRYDEIILIEEAIVGREIELAVLEAASPGGLPRVSLPGEICVNHPDAFYSYTAKYLEPEQTELIVPTHLESGLLARIQKIAREIFIRLKCRGMARIDFFVNEATGKIYFNEVNTLPGFTPISMYPKLWQVSGLTYSNLLDELIKLAIRDRDCRRQLITNYQ